jgi:hypothetical protein
MAAVMPTPPDTLAEIVTFESIWLAAPGSLD